MGFMDDVDIEETGTSTNTNPQPQPLNSGGGVHHPLPPNNTDENEDLPLNPLDGEPLEGNTLGESSNNSSRTPQTIPKRALDFEWSPRKKRDLKIFGEIMCGRLDIPDDDQDEFIEACQVCYCLIVSALLIILLAFHSQALNYHSWTTATAYFN